MFVGAGIATTLSTGPARAQGADAATALTLFDEGKQLVARGNYLEGCSKLLASYNVVPKLGTLLNLADCYERSGKTASAWVRFTEAATIAERAGQQERTEFARTHAAALGPKLSRLVITAPAAPIEGLEVRRDGALVDPAVFGTPVPVDPGPHVLEARAPHKKTWTTDVEIAPAAPQPRAIAIPSLEPDAAPAVALGGAPGSPSYGPPSSADAVGAEPTAASAGGTQRTVAFVLGGVGGAGLIASVIGGVIAKNQYASSNDPGGCAGNACSQRGLDDRSSASTTAGVSTVVFIGGALLVATGVVLYLTAPSSARSGAPSSARSAASSASNRR